MYQGIYTIKNTTKIARDVFETVLLGDTSSLTAPGQFIDIKLEGFFLRRPLSVCDWGDGSLTIIYKTIGGGTEYLSSLPSGTELDVLCGLGNGFDTAKGGESPLIIGGGVGVPPLYALCKKLIVEGARPTVILGFNSAEDAFYADKFAELGAKVLITTVDGSMGTKGFVTDAMKNLDNYTYFYTCGPEPMLKAVHTASRSDGQLSFEERMGCGFGACMGCSCKTKYGSKRICKEGPVLEKEEIIWQTSV